MKWVENNCTKKGFGWGTNKWSKTHIKCIHTISKERKLFLTIFFYYYQLATFPNQGYMYSNKNSNNSIVWLDFCFLNFPFYCWGFGLRFGTKIRTFHFVLQIEKKWQQNAKKFQSFKTTNLIEIGTFHFHIENSKIIDIKFGKTH
jgi:hypothetical protein